MVTAKGRARAKKSWRTRRKRYGKDGVMDTKVDVRETWFQITKGNQRRRPATHYFMGDQIKPLGATKKLRNQWQRTVMVDKKRPGVKYEVWERIRVKSSGLKHGADRWIAEWAHMNDPAPKGNRVKLVKLV